MVVKLSAKFALTVNARVAELVDTADLKSVVRKDVVCNTILTYLSVLCIKMVSIGIHHYRLMVSVSHTASLRTKDKKIALTRVEQVQNDLYNQIVHGKKDTCKPALSTIKLLKKYQVYKIPK